MTDRQERLKSILTNLNKAKDAMSEVCRELEAEGFYRKANALMNKIYDLEQFQNSRG